MTAKTRPLLDRIGTDSVVLSVMALMSGTTVVGLLYSFLHPLLSIALDQQGYSATIIGLNAAAFSLGIMVAVPQLPRLTPHFRSRTLILFGILAGAVVLLLLGLTRNVYLWFVLRFVEGLLVALPFQLCEASINTLVSERMRGRLMGLFGAIFCIGYASGPLLITVFGTEGFVPFLAAASLMVVAGLPIVFARRIDYALRDREDKDGIVQRFIRILPLTLLPMTALLAFGALETVEFAFLPLYIMELGHSVESASWVLAVLISGNVFLQYPVGWLSDRWERKKALVLCGVLALFSFLAMILAGDNFMLMQAALFFAGGFSGGLYTTSMAEIGSRFRGNALMGASAILVLAFETGAIVGPLVTGQIIDLGSIQALPPVMMVMMIFPVIVWLMIRHRSVNASGRVGNTLNP